MTWSPPPPETCLDITLGELDSQRGPLFLSSFEANWDLLRCFSVVCVVKDTGTLLFIP